MTTRAGAADWCHNGDPHKPHYGFAPTEATPDTSPCPGVPHRCVAHGKTVVEHVGGYAHDCTEPPVRTENGGCADCGTYWETGMHWDTCAQRGRHRGLTADQQPSPVLIDDDDDEDPEIATLRLVAEKLGALDTAAQQRAVRWLFSRFLAGDRS